jgi:ATP-dependent protease ClpP protease subunit
MSNNEYDFFRFEWQPPLEALGQAVDDLPVVAELSLYAPIGAAEDIGETAAAAFAKDLAKLPSSIKRLDIHINSPGGSVSEAQAIYSRLADHRSEKIVYVDGLAASAASLIAMVGHKRYIRSNATMMIHAPSAATIGNAEVHRHSAGVLDRIGDSMLAIYTKRTGLDRDRLKSMMNEETWMTAEEAVELGFADEVRGVIKAAACAGPGSVIFNGLTHDVSAYRNVPAFPPVKAKPKKKAPLMDEPIVASAAAPVQEPEPKPKPAPLPTEPRPEPKPGPDPDIASLFDSGVKAERGRVIALTKLLHPLTQALVTEAIAKGLPIEEVIPRWLEVMAGELGESTSPNADIQAARHLDAQGLNAVKPGDAPRGKLSRDELGRMLSDKTKARAKLMNRGRFIPNNKQN